MMMIPMFFMPKGFFIVFLSIFIVNFSQTFMFYNTNIYNNYATAT